MNTDKDLGYKTAPRHPHSCRNCTFVGHDGQHDLYYCASEGTVIARWGVEGEYYSGMCFSFGSNPHLTEARRRAQLRGILKYPFEEAVRQVRTTADADQACRDELRAAMGKEPVALAMQWARKNDARIGAQRITALAESRALQYQAQFPDLDLVELRGWVQSFFEAVRAQLEAFGLQAPDCFEVMNAVHHHTSWDAPRASRLAA